MGAFHPILWIVGILWWVCLFIFGIFQTIVWTIVIISIVIIILKLKGNI